MIKAFIVGRLTAAPERRVTPKGTTITEFSLASNEVHKDAEGAKIEHVSYVDCEAWGKLGDTIAQYFKSGDQIAGGFRVRQERWEDKKTEKKRSRVKFILEEFEFCAQAVANQDRPAKKTEAS